jgi:hypothetical protein
MPTEFTENCQFTWHPTGTPARFAWQEGFSAAFNAQWRLVWLEQHHNTLL